jgi:hypothetical protein
MMRLSKIRFTLTHFEFSALCVMIGFISALVVVVLFFMAIA